MSRLLTLTLLVLSACSSTETRPRSRVFPMEGIAGELVAMAEEDQALRKELVAAMAGESGGEPDADQAARMMAVDQRNTARLKEIVAEHGWPRVSQVGEKGAHAAWLLVQHADLDPGFQAEVLGMLEPLVKLGEIRSQDYALLVDRVRAARGKPQLYGTQYTMAVVEGEVVFHPSTEIEDPENLDARRAEMDLPPHAEYLETLKQVYGGGERPPATAGD